MEKRTAQDRMNDQQVKKLEKLIAAAEKEVVEAKKQEKVKAEIKFKEERVSAHNKQLSKLKGALAKAGKEHEDTAPPSGKKGGKTETKKE